MGITGKPTEGRQISQSTKSMTVGQPGSKTLSCGNKGAPLALCIQPGASLGLQELLGWELPPDHSLS